MRKLILAMMFVLPISASAFCQTVDTFNIDDIYVLPGSSATIPVNLTNNMFNVAGFTLFLNLSDSLAARFVSVQRGADAGNFEYYNIFCDTGTIRIVAIADMLGGVVIPSLPIGTHEVARINLAVAASAPVGMSSQIEFNNSRTSITDSTGYWVIYPITNDGAVIFGGGQGIESNAGVIDGFSLDQNFPNPFNGQTRISFQVQEPGSANLEIYDILGRRIAAYDQGYVQPGIHNFIWDGKDQDGNGLSSGVYFYRLTYEGRGITKKFSLIK